jgi:hypothetical protein
MMSTSIRDAVSVPRFSDQWATSAPSASQMGRFETEFLSTDDNIAALADLSGVWIDRVHDRRPSKTVTLDMDSSVGPTDGDQEGTAYNGPFG